MIKNMSNFYDIGDYLPLIIAALIVDMLIMARVVFGYINLTSLKDWYNKFGFMSVIADVLSIVLGVVAARFLYSYLFSNYSLLLFLLLACIIQFTHDLSFAAFFNSVPRGKSEILDVFKDYGKENGITTLFVDAFMIISTIVLGGFLATMSTNIQIIILMLSLYILPYLLYSIK
jgi:hypothetical protein